VNGHINLFLDSHSHVPTDSTTIGNFWRTWNLPVHRFLKTHVFVPMMQAGFSKPTVAITAFMISAIAHEFIVSVAFYTVGYMAFVGMLLQMPAVIVSEIAFRNYRQAGNLFFWATILLGQPLIVLFYYMDYQHRMANQTS
jgi:diacylglycerol O-acyltransferase-1